MATAAIRTGTPILTSGALPEVQAFRKVVRMETTLTLDDAVMRELREEAARRGTSLSALVEVAVSRLLAERPAPEAEREPDELPPLPSWNLGKPLVDVADREALYEAIDAERDLRLYGTRAY